MMDPTIQTVLPTPESFLSRACFSLLSTPPPCSGALPSTSQGTTRTSLSLPASVLAPVHWLLCASPGQGTRLSSSHTCPIARVPPGSEHLLRRACVPAGQRAVAHLTPPGTLQGRKRARREEDNDASQPVRKRPGWLQIHGCPQWWPAPRHSHLK